MDNPPLVDSIALSGDECWTLARFVGALSAFGLTDKPLKRASRKAQNMDQALVTVGATLMPDRSQCFDFLDRIRAPDGMGRSVQLLSEGFPQLLTMMRKQLGERPRQWMMHLLEAYVSYSSRTSRALIWERKNSTDLPPPSHPYNARVRNSAIAALIAASGQAVPTRNTSAGRQKYVIDNVLVEKLQRERNRMVSVKAAAKHAGLSVRRIPRLAEAKLISAHGNKIDICSVDRFLDALRSACRADMQDLQDPVSIADVLRMYVLVEGSAQFFTRIFGQAKLACRAPQEPTLQNIFLDRCDVNSAVLSQLVSNTQLSIVQAAGRIKVKQQVMYHLVAIGLMPTHIGKIGGRMSRLVDSEDLIRFSKRFLPLITVANGIGIAARKAPIWAREEGLELVSGPSIDNGRQYWIRCPIDPVIRKKIGLAAEL